jgi:hypothetical protein
MNDRLLQKNSSIICFSVLFILLLSSCKVAQQTQVNQSTKPAFLDSAILLQLMLALQCTSQQPIHICTIIKQKNILFPQAIPKFSLAMQL